MRPEAYYNKGWGIMFCPFFFKKSYLTDVTAAGPKPLAQLGSLYTYEHLLVHELMHCDIVRTKELVDDLTGNIPGQRDGQGISSASRCHEWAWKDNRGPLGPVNIKPALNADNYAWFFTNRWFDKQWKWNEYVGGSWFGHPADGNWIQKKRDGQDQDDGTNPIDDNILSDYPQSTTIEDGEYGEPESIDFGPAINRHTNGDDPDNDVVCDYVGELYSDYVDDIDEPFLSSGNCTLS